MCKARSSELPLLPRLVAGSRRCRRGSNKFRLASARSAGKSAMHARGPLLLLEAVRPWKGLIREPLRYKNGNRRTPESCPFILLDHGEAGIGQDSEAEYSCKFQN